MKNIGIIHLLWIFFLIIPVSCKNIENSGISGDELATIALKLQGPAHRADPVKFSKDSREGMNRPFTHNTRLSAFNKTAIQGMAFLFTGRDAFADIPVNLFGMDADWKNARHLQLDLYNPAPAPSGIRIALIGRYGMINDTLTIPENTKVFFRLDLDELPLIVDKSDSIKIKYLRIGAAGNNHLESIVLTGLQVLPYLEVAQNPVIDKFGQRYAGSWPEKIGSTDELKDEHIAGQNAFSADSDKLATGRYGGWKDGKKYRARGSFYTTSIDEAWWIISPLGYPFWGLGVGRISQDGLRKDAIVITNNEDLIEGLPGRESKFDKAYLSENRFSFYAYNILRKYGSFEKWQQSLDARIDSWGFNTVLCAVEKGFYSAPAIPYISVINTNRQSDLLIGNTLCDYFDPRWENYIDSLFTKMRDNVTDSFLLGYLVDNDLEFHSNNLLRILPADAPSRYQWEILVKQRYGWSLRNLNASLGSDYASWDSIRNIPAPEYDDLQNIYSDFESAFIDKYFRTISHTLKKYDPAHLYMGPAIHTKSQDITELQKTGRYCDIIVVFADQQHAGSETIKKVYDAGGKPVFVEIENLPLHGDQDIPSVTKRYTPAQRAGYLYEQTKRLADLPFVVGILWEPLTDRPVLPSPGSDINKITGFVSITDISYHDLTGSARKCSNLIYMWHAGMSKP